MEFFGSLDCMIIDHGIFQLFWLVPGFSLSLSFWGISIQFEWMVILLTWMCLSTFLLCSWFICFLVSHELFQIDFLTCFYRNGDKSLPLAYFILFCPHFGWMARILQLYSYQRGPQMYLHLRNSSTFWRWS